MAALAPERQFAEVDVGGYPVRVKRGPRRIKAEHDDAARVAALLRLPVREVARRAEEAAHRLFEGTAAGAGVDDGTEPQATRAEPGHLVTGRTPNPCHCRSVRPNPGLPWRRIRPGTSAMMDRCCRPAI